MQNRSKYLIIFILSFILYGNTLFHDYALDDAIVITDNAFVLDGFDGIKDIFSEEFFSGFFDQKNKKLVAGGRYRPLSMVTFAIEWDLVMGSPFDGLNIKSIENRLNQNADPNYILPSQKLLKDLARTIHIDHRKQMVQQQELILKDSGLSSQEKEIVIVNLNKIHHRRGVVLFVSHFINVLLFAITSLVLFVLLHILLPKNRNGNWYLSVPFIAVLLFVVHPIHTEVVANIKGRDEILSLLGALLAMFFTFRYVQRQKLIYLVFIFLSFVAGLFSKEVAVTFLAIIPLSIYFFSKGDKNLRFGIVIFIPLLFATIIYFYVRHRVVGGMSFEPSNELMNNSFLGMSFSEKYATIFYTLLLYLKLLIFPHPLTYDYYPYHISVMNWGDIWPIISLVIYVILGVYAIIKFKKKSTIAFGILFYIITLSPTSNILFSIGVFMNERFVYTSSIGIILIFAYFISVRLPLCIKNKRYVMYTFILILSLYSIKTISRNRDWKDDFTLFTHDVEISRNSAKSNTSAGGKLIEEAIKPENSLVKDEYLKRAIKYLNRAITIHPIYNDALLLMGNAQWELYHNLDSTFKYYHRILERTPKFNEVYTNIFESDIRSEFENGSRAKQNIEILHWLEKYNPNYFKTNYYLGRVYGRYLQDIEKSKIYLEKAASINPNNLVVFKDLGVAYGISKEYEKSANAFIKAVELDKNDPTLRINLAMTYANLREQNKALDQMDQVLGMDLKKDNARLLVSLASMYQNMNRADKAQQCYSKAKQLNPDLFKK